MNTLLLSIALAALLGQDVPATATAKKPKVGSSPAEQYADALAKLLMEYQKQLSAKIAAEQAAYTEAAKLYDDAFRTNKFDTLANDRIADTQRDQRALEEGRITPAKLLEHINEYADRDFHLTKSAFEQRIDWYSSYLSGLNAIQSDSQKITTLIAQLHDLAAKPNWNERLTQLTTYGQDFVKQYQFSDCSMSDSLLAIANAKVSALTVRLQGTSDPLQQAALNAQLTAANATVTDLQAKRLASGAFSTGKCAIQ